MFVVVVMRDLTLLPLHFPTEYNTSADEAEYIGGNEIMLE